MALNEKKKREYLQNITKFYLLTAKAVLEYYKAVAEDKKQKLICNKAIKNTDQALVFVNEVKHIEILEYFYSILIGNSAVQYSVSGKVVNSKKIKYFDTDKGFKEFQEMIEKQKQEALEREKRQKEIDETLKKAKEMGKKVEMVYDSTSKTTKPMIIEDKDNN